MGYSIVVTEHFIEQYIQRRGIESLGNLWNMLDSVREINFYVDKNKEYNIFSDGYKKGKIFLNDGYAIAAKVKNNKIIFMTYLYDRYNSFGQEKKIKVEYNLTEKITFLSNLLKIIPTENLEKILFNYN